MVGGHLQHVELNRKVTTLGRLGTTGWKGLIEIMEKVILLFFKELVHYMK